MERTLNVDIYNNYILYNKNNRFIQNDMKTCFLKYGTSLHIIIW